jgi:hypothetical protein
MTRKRQPWPRSALWALEDTLACLSEIEADARKAQALVVEGKTLDAVMMLGDIRTKCAEARITLAKGRSGER